MKIKVKDISSTKKKLSIDVPVEMVQHAFDEGISHVRKKANIKGFRKGKVPEKVLEQHYGGEIQYESLNHLVNHTYPEALKEHNLIPVLQPKFDLGVLEKGKNFSYAVEVEVKPEFELKDYTGIPLKKRIAEITQGQIVSELERLQESRAELNPVEEGTVLSAGLVASIDFEGTMEGKPFPGGAAKGHVFEFGKGNLMKDFEDPMEGMKVGEQRDIQMTYPADFPNEYFRGKQATFRVTLQALHSKVLPLLDDEFAKDLGKENFEAVQKEIEAQLIKIKEREFRQHYAEEIVNYLLKKHSFDVPEGLIHHELEHAEEGKKRSREEIERSIRTEFILETVAKKESVNVTPQELEAHLRFLSQAYREPIDKIKNYYSDRGRLSGLLARLLMEKTLDLLIGKAKLEA